MNKVELVAAIAEKAGLSKKDAEGAVKAFVEVVTDELRVNDALYLTQWGIAPDFVLQAEKWQPDGVCPLDNNGKVDPQYLPPVYTTAIVKIGTGIFSNSDTSVVVDADITADSFIAISNMQ